MYKVSKGRNEVEVVIFLDGSTSAVRVPREQSLDCLKAAVEEKLHISECRLFFAQVRVCSLQERGRLYTLT